MAIQASGTSNSGSSSSIWMILSPAKTLDFATPNPVAAMVTEQSPAACDVEKTKQIVNVMKQFTKSELAKRLKLSAPLADSTYEQWNNFAMITTTTTTTTSTSDDEIPSKDHNDEDNNTQHMKKKKPCIFAYSGAAYQGLDAHTCSTASIEYMQSHLRILDAVYGVLRPLDLIQPYRLEMNTKLFNDQQKLCHFWKDSVTQYLANSMNENSILLNLASEEYTAAVDMNVLSPRKCIKCVFYEEGKVVTVHTKRARGLMVRYMADNAIENLEDVKKFDLEGYRFVEHKSDETTLVFERTKQSKRGNDQKLTVKSGATKRSKR
jgi:hypothetical protein